MNAGDYKLNVQRKCLFLVPTVIDCTRAVQRAAAVQALYRRLYVKIIKSFIGAFEVTAI